MNSPVLQIVIFRDGNPVGTEVFLPGDYTVGSHDGCELLLTDPKWPPFHARLSFRGGRVHLSNQSRTAAAVRLNGQLFGDGEVSSRDDVALGPFLLKFRVMSGPSSSAEKTSGPSSPAPFNLLNLPPIARQPTPLTEVSADLVTPYPDAAPVERVPAATRSAKASPPAPAPTPEPLAESASELAVPLDAAPEPVPPLGPSPATPFASPDAAQAKPSLRVRVFWGRTMVGIHGFPFGQEVVAGAREKAGVPLYGLALPQKPFSLASVDKGTWTIRVPPGLTAYRFESPGWKPVAAASTGASEGSRIPMGPGEVVRMGNARHSIEVRVDRVPAVRRKSIREQVDPQFGIPLGIVSALAIAAMVAMPQFQREQGDFVPRRIAPVRALLKPPEKKKEEKKPEEKKEKEEKVKEKTPKPTEVKTKAIKAVEKTAVAVKAVESLLKATTKIVADPKGYGDKGLGFKISPLIGKPPITQAGIGFGAGMGGFGATKGLGDMRGMGAGGAGIGAFATRGLGKGKVAGAVISAPARKAQIRGQIDRELIAKVINEHMGEIRGCYERALLKQASLAGKLVIEWTIEPSGTVSSVGVKNNTLQGPEVADCIMSNLRRWPFPKPTGGEVVVSYPFLFNSVGF